MLLLPIVTIVQSGLTIPDNSSYGGFTVLNFVGISKKKPLGTRNWTTDKCLVLHKPETERDAKFYNVLLLFPKLRRKEC